MIGLSLVDIRISPGGDRISNEILSHTGCSTGVNRFEAPVGSLLQSVLPIKVLYTVAVSS